MSDRGYNGVYSKKESLKLLLVVSEAPFSACELQTAAELKIGVVEPRDDVITGAPVDH